MICFSFNKDDPVKVYPPSLREFSSDDETDVSSYDSDSDISWPVVSPMTSSDEEDPFDECDEGESIEDVPIPPSTYHIEESSPTQQQSSTTEVPGYRLCGDNVDKSVKHRYMRSDASSNVSSIHYFHSYAAKNRVNTSGLSDAAPDSPAKDQKKIALSLLPSPSDDSIMKENFAIHLSRVLVEHVPFFEHSFDGAVSWHVTYKYSEQMKLKSDMVSIVL